MRRLLWAVATAFIVYASTLPFAVVYDRDVVGTNWQAAVQRSALSERSHLSRADLLQNVLLFVPIGILGVTTQRRSPFAALLTTIGAAALISTTCELLQLFTVDRTTSAWDVWANVGGAVAGGLIGFAALLVIRAFDALPATREERREAFLCLCALALVVIAACEPFDITLDVGTVWQHVKPLLTGGLLTVNPVSDELLTVVRFAFLSCALSMTSWLPVRRPSTQRIVVVVLCCMLAVALETSQALIASRSPALQDVVAAALGTIAGAFAGPALVRGHSVPLLVTIATAVAAVPFYVAPFELSSTYRQIAVVPFLAYYQFTTMQTVSHVADLMLIYAPIGFAYSWARPNGPITRALVASGLVAAVLELAQGSIVGRYPDVTDIGMALLGTFAGAIVAQRGIAHINESPS